MSIKTGPKAMTIPAHYQAKFIAEKEFTIMSVNADGEMQNFIASSQNQQVRLRTMEEEVQIYVSVPKTCHWAVDLTPINPHEKTDPVPVEVPADKLQPIGMLDRLKQMLAGVVAEHYGRDSDQMETFEESMDFDMDEDPDIFSGYEVEEMVDDYPIQDEPQKTDEQSDFSGDDASSEVGQEDVEKT